MEKETLKNRGNIEKQVEDEEVEIKIQKFINKINKMHKENAKEHDYAVGIEDFKTELQEEQLLSFYIRKLTEVTENVIKEDKSSARDS